MRTYDFAPLYRATVGFDQIADLMDQVASTGSNANTYPPYNIEKLTTMHIASRLRWLAFQTPTFQLM